VRVYVLHSRMRGFIRGLAGTNKFDIAFRYGSMHKTEA
jgi:hypothetical protein